MASTNTKIQISKTTTFGTSDIVQEYDGAYTESWALPTDLSYNTTYYVRGYHSNAGGTSDPSDVNKFKTVPAAPGKASVTAPANNATDVALSPTVTVSAATDASNTDIEIASDTGFNTKVASYSGIYLQSWTCNVTLSYKTTYYVRVKHSNISGGVWSDANTFTTLPDKPSKCSVTAPANNAENVALKPAVTVSSATGATATNIDIASNTTFTTIVQSYTGAYTESWTPTSNLSNDTTYYIRAKHSNAGGGDWSDTNTFKTIPNAPSQCSVTAPANNATNIAVKPTVTISSATGITTTDIQIASDTGFNTVVSSYTGSYVASWTSTVELSKGTTYYVRAKHSNAGGGTWSSTNTFSTIPNAPSGQTSITQPSNNATGIALKPEIKLSAATGATHTLVQIASDTGFQTIVQSYDSSYVQSWTPSNNLSNNTTYYVRGQHSNEGGSQTMSSTVTFTTIPNVPSKATITSPTNGSTDIDLKPTITISSKAGASSTRIEISTSNNFGSLTTYYDGTATESWTLTQDLAESATYFVRGRHSNAGGDGTWSDTVKFTTKTVNPVGAPAILVPQNGDTQLSTTISITVEYGTCSVAGATRNGTNIQISTSNTFSSIAVEYTGDYTEYWTAEGLTIGTTYYVRARHSYTQVGFGLYGTVSTFSTAASGPATPIVIEPHHGYFDEDLHADTTVSPGVYIGGGQEWVNTQIQISKTADFAVVVTEYNGPKTTTWYSGLLEYNTRYYIRCRHMFGTASWSNWSSANLFGVALEDFTIEFDNSLTTGSLVRWEQGVNPDFTCNFQYSLDLGGTWHNGFYNNQTWTVGLGKTRTLTIRGNFMNSAGRIAISLWKELNVIKVRGKVINLLGGQSITLTPLLTRDLLFGCRNLKSVSTNLFDGIAGPAQNECYRGICMNCSSLKRIPPGFFGGITSPQSGANEVFYDAFANCTALIGPSATTSNGTKIYNLTNIGNNPACYYGCTGLEDYAQIPADWKQY